MSKQPTLFANLLYSCLLILLVTIQTPCYATSPATTEYLLKGKFPSYPEIDYGSGERANVIKHGEYLSRVGDCLACHSDIKPGAKAFAGGLAINTPFGTFYSPNITPDKKTGIGNWRFEDFKRAMHHGKNPKAKNYFPVFPYLYYTKLSDQDLRAIWAYLKAVPVVEKKNKGNTMIFPLSWRFTQYGWKMLYFYPYSGEYEYNPDQSKQWNRGAYLVKGLGHCSMCHTPLNFFGAPKRKYFMTGAFIEDYWAPNITKKGLEGATKQDIINVFKKGELINRRGPVAGPMAQVVHESLRYLSDYDAEAIATYLKSIESKQPIEVPHGAAPRSLARGRKVFNSACKLCHLQGLAGAPRIGNNAGWEVRVKKGLRVLYRNTLKGYNNMPIKGACVTCSDEDIEAAVDYLVYSSLTSSQWRQLEKRPVIQGKLSINDGKRIYIQACASCHKEGKLGSPKVGDKAAWQPFIKKNIDVLVTNTIAGPTHPKMGGCKHCTTGEIIAAVKYMVEESKTKGDYSLW